MTPSLRSQVVNWSLVVLAVAALVAVALTQETVTSGEELARERHLFVALRPEKVSRIELDGEARWVITRGTGDEPRFRIVEPIQAEAEQATVDRLLQNIGFATGLRRVDNAARKELGLETPERVIRLQIDGAWQELRLGAEAPSPPGARYLEITGSAFAKPGVVVVSASVARELSVPTDEFRVLRLMPYLASQLHRLEIRAEGVAQTQSSSLALAQVPNAGWHFAEHFARSRADRDTLERFFLELSRPGGDDFLPVDEAQTLQANQPLVQLTLMPNGDGLPAAHIVVGGSCPRNPARSLALRTVPEPIAACIDARVVYALVEHPELLLDQHLFRLRSDEVEELKIEGSREQGQPVPKLELARRGEGFIMRAPKSAEVARQAGQERLEAVLNARGEWLPVGPEGFTLKAPLRTVSLTQAALHEETVTTERVALSASDEQGVVYARREVDGAVLRLDKLTARAFEIDASLIRSHELLSLERDAIGQVTLEWEEQRQVLKRGEPHQDAQEHGAHSPFSLVEPHGFAVDVGLAADLIDALRTLTAVRWVSDQGLDTPLASEFGLNTPRLRVTIEHSSANSAANTETARRHQLIVGNASPDGGFYANLDGDGIFLVSRRLYETLTTLLVDRSALLLDAEQIQSLRLTTPQGSWELERLGTTLVQRAGPSELGADRILELLDALSLLRAEAAVSLADPTPVQGRDQPTLAIDATLVPERFALPVERRLRIGRADLYHDFGIYYGWREGQRGVFALPQASVRRILDLL